MSNSEKKSESLRFKVSVNQELRALHADISNVRTNFRGKRLVQLAAIGLAVVEKRDLASVGLNIEGIASGQSSSIPRKRGRRVQESATPPEATPGQPALAQAEYIIEPASVDLMAEALGHHEPLNL